MNSSNPTNATNPSNQNIQQPPDFGGKMTALRILIIIAFPLLISCNGGEMPEKTILT